MNIIRDFVQLPVELNKKHLLDNFELGLYRIAFIEDFKLLDVKSYLDEFKSSKKLSARVKYNSVLLADFSFIKDSLHLTKRETWVLILSFINKNPQLFLENKDKSA